MTAFLRFSRHRRRNGSPTRTDGTSPSGAFVRLARCSSTAGTGGIESMRGGCDARRIRIESTSCQERVVGRSTSGAALGMAEEEIALVDRHYFMALPRVVLLRPDEKGNATDSVATHEGTPEFRSVGIFLNACLIKSSPRDSMISAKLRSNWDSFLSRTPSGNVFSAAQA